VLLTSDELRHRYVRSRLAAHHGVDLVATFTEPHAQATAAAIGRRSPLSALQRGHFEDRAASEAEFFAAGVERVEVRSDLRPLARGGVNDPEVVAAILGYQPDAIAAFGCSIIGPPLIEAFAGPIVNLHLGLSPYYRGSGTNFWPLVNGEPELVGATFLHLDAGIDTGPVIHQLRARVHSGDSAHQIGNRVIADAAEAFPEVLVVATSPDAGPRPSSRTPTLGREYRRAEVDDAAIEALHQQFAEGLVAAYLDDVQRRTEAAPIVEHPAVPPIGDRA